jgi:hypothetical protein
MYLIRRSRCWLTVQLQNKDEDGVEDKIHQSKEEREEDRDWGSECCF